MKITKIYLLTLLLILFNLSASAAWTSTSTSTSDWATTQAAGFSGTGLDVDDPSDFNADLDAYINEENAFRAKLVVESSENQDNIASNITATSTANDSLIAAQAVEVDAQELFTAAQTVTAAKFEYLGDMEVARDAAVQNVLDIATDDQTIDPNDPVTHSAIYTNALADEINAIDAFTVANVDHNDAVALQASANDGLTAATVAVEDVNSTLDDLATTASSLTARTSILNTEISNIDNRISGVADAKVTLGNMLLAEELEHQDIINTINAFADNDYSDDLDALIETIDNYDTFDPNVDVLDEVTTTLTGSVLDHTDDANLTNEVISSYSPSVTTADLVADYTSHLDSITSILSEADQTSLIENMSNGAWEREAVTSNYSNITDNTSDISTNAGLITDNALVIDDNFNAITTHNGLLQEAGQLITSNSDNITTITTNGIADIITVEDDGSIHIGENSFVTNQVNDVAGVGGQQDIYGTDINGDFIDLNVSNGSGLTIAGEAVATEVYVDNGDSILSGNISTNAGDISINASGISTNVGGISTNAGGISTNAGGISTNADDISDNAGLISTNAGGISTNADDISDNAGLISTNAGGISTNAGLISTNASGISDNAGDISNNSSDISTNFGLITDNAGDITTNAGGISTNASGISTNAGDITTNAGGISTNASGISTNASGISTNASDISTNASVISTNGSDISDNVGVISYNAG
jgi:hypothetical protein